jgi:hypothetical protein
MLGQTSSPRDGENLLNQQPRSIHFILYRGLHTQRDMASLLLQ